MMINYHESSGLNRFEDGDMIFDDYDDYHLVCFSFNSVSKLKSPLIPS